MEWGALVHPSMSPKGVEHWASSAGLTVIPACIHQCRRKALSTRSRGGWSGLRMGVHPSMSPKGVEHKPPNGSAGPATLVHPSMSPKGVEHSGGRVSVVVSSIVHPSMSPKGVEHTLQVVQREHRAIVHPSMSPKGVEHKTSCSGLTSTSSCIHQCRRKALSTSQQRLSSRTLPLCIHQCRRKALSTRSCRRPGTGQCGASINVAERR